MTSAISDYLYDYDYTYQQKQQAGNIMLQQMRQYISYLQEQYPYVNNDDTLVGGIQTSVNVSLEYLKKCMYDPEEAEFLEIQLSEIPDYVMEVLWGGYGNVSNLTFEIDDYGYMSVSITSDRSASVIKGVQERRRLEEEKADKLLEGLDKINQALSDVMSWNNSSEASFLLSLNKNNNTFSVSGIQNQLTQNNVSNIIGNNINYLLQYALNFSSNTASSSDTFNMGYTTSTGLYLLNRIWNA